MEQPPNGVMPAKVSAKELCSFGLGINIWYDIFGPLWSARDPFMVFYDWESLPIKKMGWDLLYRFISLLLTSSLDTHGRLRNSHAPRRDTQAGTLLYAADISLESGCLRFTSQLRSMIVFHLQYSTVASIQVWFHTKWWTCQEMLV